MRMEVIIHTEIFYCYDLSSRECYICIRRRGFRVRKRPPLLGGARFVAVQGVKSSDVEYNIILPPSTGTREFGIYYAARLQQDLYRLSLSPDASRESEIRRRPALVREIRWQIFKISSVDWSRRKRLEERERESERVREGTTETDRPTICDFCCGVYYYINTIILCVICNITDGVQRVTP